MGIGIGLAVMALAWRWSMVVDGTAVVMCGKPQRGRK